MSSAFESSIGLGQYAHLAAAISAVHPMASGTALDTAATKAPDIAHGAAHSEASDMAHGLATAQWFSADVVTEPLSPVAIRAPNVSNLSLAQALCLHEYCTRLLLGLADEDGFRDMH